MHLAKFGGVGLHGYKENRRGLMSTNHRSTISMQAISIFEGYRRQKMLLPFPGKPEKSPTLSQEKEGGAL